MSFIDFLLAVTVLWFMFWLGTKWKKKPDDNVIQEERRLGVQMTHNNNAGVYLLALLSGFTTLFMLWVKFNA